MKIIIKPTTESNYTGISKTRNPKVTIESDSDDLSIDEVVTMFRGALISYGYHHENVDEYLLTEYNNFGDCDKTNNEL